MVRKSLSSSLCFCHRYDDHFPAPEIACCQKESHHPRKPVAFVSEKAVAIKGEIDRDQEFERKRCENNRVRRGRSPFLPLPLEAGSQASIYCVRSRAPSLFDADENDERRWHCAFVSRQQLWKQPARQLVPVWDHFPCQGSSFDMCSPLPLCSMSAHQKSFEPW